MEGEGDMLSSLGKSMNLVKWQMELCQELVGCDLAVLPVQCPAEETLVIYTKSILEFGAT